jgi:L,D-peptidoglycan transpeptidase YkuD (ErfK/YbiS/YcfS/YnhG family)
VPQLEARASVTKPGHITITVARAPGRPSQGILRSGGQTLPVALGRSGIGVNKREGDGATPRGTFHPLRLWWRADRLPRPLTDLPVRRINRADAWCEDPSDRRYNRPICLNKKANGDRLWRDDGLYDLIIEIDHNTRPRIAGRGSAVFLHLARPGLLPTAGCIAMPRNDLLRLISRLRKNSTIRVV